METVKEVVVHRIGELSLPRDVLFHAENPGLTGVNGLFERREPRVCLVDFFHGYYVV